MLASPGEYRGRSQKFILGKFKSGTLLKAGNSPVSLPVWDFVTSNVQELEGEKHRVQNILKGDFIFKH